MNQAAGTDLCRVTIVAPQRRVDVSLPSDVPLAHMLPTLLRVAGENMADAGLAHSGWVLQKLDKAPLDPAQTLSQLSIMDGETLYFRPRMAQLPELSYDDVADVIGTGIRERSDRWRPQNTRSFGMTAAAAALGVGLLTLLLSGPPWIAPAAAAAVIALLLVGGAFSLSRAYADAGAGSVLGYLAVPYAFVAGLGAPAGKNTELLSATTNGMGSAHLMAGFGAAMLIAVIAGFAVVDGLPNFIGIALAALIGLLAALMAFTFSDLPASGVGGVAVALVLPLAALVPTLAFRLARLPLPPVPNSAEDLLRDRTTLDGANVLQRTAIADKFATGLVAGIALVAMGGILALSGSDSWAGPATMGAVSASLLLRSRVFRGYAQRMWMLGSGVFGLAVLSLKLASEGGQAGTLLGVLLPLVVAAGVVAAVAVWLPNNRPTPFWGRLGDILDVIIIVAIFPLAGYALDLFAKVRGLAG